MSKKSILAMSLIVAFASVVAVNFTASADSIVEVHPDDMAENLADVLAEPTSWFFYNDETDTIDNTLGSFVMGPGTPPEGDGSVQITVSGTQRRNLATYQFFGTDLADITELKFSTYNPSAGNVGSANRSAYLNFNVDFDGSDTWQKRLAYVPNQNGTVVQDSWQEWDAIDGGNAMWWWSGYAANGNKWPDNNTDEYRTWSDLLLSFPNIAIRTTDPWLGLRVGEPYADGYTENIDAFKFGVGGETTTFDFDPIVRSAEITSPTENGVYFGEVDFLASLTDDDADAIQWAVREGTCAAGTNTVYGNVDGHTDVATINQTDLGNQTFEFTADMSGDDPGMYCFIYNPTEDGGEANIRLTREFYVGDLSVSPLEAVNPLGTDHTVTADIAVDVAGVNILFDVVGGNETSGADETDANGQATFTYTGNSLGEDTITVCADENGNDECDEGEATVTALKTWWLQQWVTGGGNIKDGRKVVWTFGGNVGLDENGDPRGQFQIQDHSAGTKCHLKEFPSVAFPNEMTAVFSSPDCGGVDVTIVDNGEPGTDDTIVVSGGDINIQLADLSGGNFQIHTVEPELVEPLVATLYADGSVGCPGADDLSDPDGYVELTSVLGGVDYTIYLEGAEPNRTYMVAISQEPACAAASFPGTFDTDANGDGTFSGHYAVAPGTYDLLVNMSTDAAGLSDAKHREIATAPATTNVIVE